VVRKIEGGQVTTLAGTGSYGFKNGPATTAQFSELTDVEVDAAGTVYVADQLNHRIRTISNGQVATLAGSGISGHQDGPAASAQFFSIWGLAVTPSGDAVYVTENSQWHTIRKIAAGTVSTIAGGSTDGYLDGPVATAQFDSPFDVAVDGQGSLFITDSKNNRIRKIAGGMVTTVAGGSEGFMDGPATLAQFDHPMGLALYGDSFYIADTSNHRVRAFRP
jgi:DNA-binding beta-propeller fold protein YncE